MGGATRLVFRKLPYEDGAQELSKKGAKTITWVLDLSSDF
jgi:hypothetical protein